ncbi:DUF3800 domain-containing protein [Roseibium album]|uniref:DUF3800 domain-containing protein n=1 Tax=Roseibium album TaxID=311410 RepID=UPI0024933843|nr:DUF3800 domain-containing protein [Roseibium album]
MVVRRLFFDESGYTGYNLLDPAQPIFTMASTDTDEQESEAILRGSFPNYQAAEFKFTNIWRRQNSRNGFFEFARFIGDQPERSFVFITEKRFCVLTKIVDFLIEPSFTNSGYNFYSDGFPRKYSNLAYFTFKFQAHPELLNTLLRDYLEFSRNPSIETLGRFQWKMRLLANSCDDERIRSFLNLMANGADLFLKFNDLENFRSSNDLHMSTMMAIVTHWRERTLDDLEIYHDASSAFFREREMWENITNPGVVEQIYTRGDGAEIPFPLNVIETQSVDSETSFAIQYCDVLAGICAKHFGTEEGDESRAFLDELIDAGLGALPINKICPEPVFPDQFPPKPLDGPDVVDQLAAIVRGSQGQIDD